MARDCLHTVTIHEWSPTVGDEGTDQGKRFEVSSIIEGRPFNVMWTDDDLIALVFVLIALRSRTSIVDIVNFVTGMSEK